MVRPDPVQESDRPQIFDPTLRMRTEARAEVARLDRHQNRTTYPRGDRKAAGDP